MKKGVYNYLINEIQECNASDRQNACFTVMEKFGINIGAVADIFALKKDIMECDVFEVFALLYALDESSLSDYFSKEEINKYMEDKKKEIEYPITLNDMVQVKDNQWIGKTSLQELMKFKEAGLINYEENKQRAYRTIKQGDSSIKEIKTALEKERYIPDDITLNMPDGSEFNYFEKEHSLEIHKLPNNMFNIIDGYQRYIAMSQIYNYDKTFDYPMELRIVNFKKSKAEQFVFQKDQKTVMKKVVSKTNVRYSVSNKVVSSLNQDIDSELQGMIGRNNEKISMVTLSSLIDWFYVKDNYISIGDESAYSKDIAEELKGKFNSLINSDPDYREKEYSDELLLVLIYLFHNNIEVNTDLIIQLTDTCIIEKPVFTSNHNPRKKTIDRLNKYVKEIGTRKQ